MTRAIALLALLAALVVSGCGGDEDKPTIPRAEADRLVDLLRDARVQAGDQDRCDKLEDLVREIRAEVDSLPNSVDRDTRRTLRDGVANLEDSSRSECQDVETTETETTPTTETETTPPPTETETVPPPTETEPPSTETEPPPPTETEPPPPPEEPDDGNGNGGNQPGFVPPGQEKKRKKDKDK